MTGESRELAGVWYTPVWYHGSRRFLYFAASDLSLASVDGDKPRLLGTIDLPAGMRIASGSVHPEGTQLALIAAEPFHFEVWVLRDLVR